MFSQYMTDIDPFYMRSLFFSPCGFVRTWLPFLIMAAIIIGLAVGLSA